MNVAHYVSSYKELAKIPELKSAQIADVEYKSGQLSAVVQVEWRCRDLSSLRFQRSTGFYIIKGKDVISHPASLVAPNVVLQSLSPSGKFNAQIIQDDQEMLLIIADSNGCIKSIDLKEKDLHGKVYCDPYISCLEWSTDEQRIAYVAELKYIEGPSYYKSSKENNGENESDATFDKYIYRDDWGEQMRGQYQGTIVSVEISSGELKLLPLPDALTPGELLWVPNSHDIIGVANVSKPFKIGLAYSSDRESFLFCMSHEGKFTELTGRGEHVKFPRFDPDGKNLIYQKSTTFGDRAPTAQLYLMTWADKKETLIVDYVNNSLKVTNGTFRGLCGKSLFPRRCFDRSGRRILVSSFNLASYEMYLIDLELKTISVIPHQSSYMVQDVMDDWFLTVSSSLTEPSKLYLAKVPLHGKEHQIEYIQVTPNFSCGLDSDWYDLWEFPSPIQDLSGKDIALTALYFGPKKRDPEDNYRPLICWPHGGPHQVIANVFSHLLAFFITLGYSIVFPNYRGSVGHGNDFLTSSLGQCGIADVEDCHLSITECLKRFPDVLNHNQLHLVGMSHGGFLAAHLTSKFPDTFCSATLLNPALDVYSMATVSDIPEWAFLEYGLPYSIGRACDRKSVQTMFERSPVHAVDKVKTPTLICLGSQDIRVPPSQGLNYYRMLLARNVPTMVYMYDDNHPLLKVTSESDYVIQIAKWFSKYKSITED